MDALFWSLPLPGGAPASQVFNTSDLVALTRLPPWVLVVAGAGLSLALVLSVRASRGAPRSVRVGLATLRGALSVLLFVLLLEPGVRQMATSREPNHVAIALDLSESMQQAGDDDTPRIRQAARAAQAILERIESDDRWTAELLGFAEEVQPLTLDALDALATGASLPQGQRSNLGGAVAGLRPTSDARPLGGVVLISDGADTAGLSPALTASLQDKLASLGAPFHTVVVGAKHAFRDIGLDRVLSDDFAFVRNPVSVTLELRHPGFRGAEIPITLHEDGQPLKTERVLLSDDDDVTSASFSFEPKAAGQHVYTLSTPVRPDEMIAENNRIDFPLRVIRDRIRVLQVAGRPSWDERFLRRLLKENPSVDLISFFILRSTTDNARAASSELSLIPFPTRELFTEELSTFDVVIFQDFNVRPYQMGLYLQNVRRFVEETGGGFMMIGGALSFSEGEYDTTPIADILPVRLLSGPGHLSEERFAARLTKAGRTHPVTNLDTLTSGSRGFSALPQLEGLNLVAGLAPGAEALVVHPFLNAGGAAAPVIAVREVGAGRTMAVMTDSTWQWSLPHVGAGGRGDAHRRLFANALRWLIRDPELSRVKLTVSPPRAAPGEPVDIEVRTFDAAYQPAGGVTITLQLGPLDGSRQRVTQTVVTDAGGVGNLRFVPDAAGAWRVEATGRGKEGRSLGRTNQAFIVDAAKKEVVFSSPRADILQAIAEAGGGQSVAPDAVARLAFKDQEVVRVHKQKTEPGWHRPELLALLALLAGTEWWWRRRRGFA